MASVSIENLISTNFSNHQKSVNDEEYQRHRNDAPVHDASTGNVAKNTSIPTSSSFASESLRQQILAQIMNAKGEEVAVDTVHVQIQNEISTTLEYIVGTTLTNIVLQKTTTLSAFKSSPSNLNTSPRMKDFALWSSTLSGASHPPSLVSRWSNLQKQMGICTMTKTGL